MVNYELKKQDMSLTHRLWLFRRSEHQRDVGEGEPLAGFPLCQPGGGENSQRHSAHVGHQLTVGLLGKRQYCEYGSSQIQNLLGQIQNWPLPIRDFGSLFGSDFFYIICAL